MPGPPTRHDADPAAAGSPDADAVGQGPVPREQGQSRVRQGQPRVLTGQSRVLTGQSRVLKGRGATWSPSARYLARRTELEPEALQPGERGTGAGAGAVDEIDADDPFARRDPRTTLLADRTVRLITTNRSPDINFNQSINAYKGCEHGCVYCFARPTHAYLDLSPGLDFETQIFYKTNVAERLAGELARRGYQPQVIAMGTNTDPYQPAEKDKRITRTILETLLEFRHPVSIVTKSQLILRDLDVLTELAALGLVSVHVSVTTLDNSLKTKLEPRTAGPAARLKVVRSLRDADVPVGAMVAPLIPFINDAELEAIVGACADAGARALGYILLRLPLEVAPLFEHWLETHYPLKAERVLAAVRAMRGGKLYDSAWGKRMRGEGPFARLIADRFRKAATRHGLHGAQLPAPRTDLFRTLSPAVAAGQQSLF